jgi:co-chaperonin GroES (HSP10)
MDFELFGNRVLFEQIKEKKDEKPKEEVSPGGIIIPGTISDQQRAQKQMNFKGRVVGIGPDVTHVNVGDEIEYNQYGGVSDFYLGDKVYLMCDETQLFGKYIK